MNRKYKAERFIWTALFLLLIIFCQTGSKPATTVPISETAAVSETVVETNSEYLQPLPELSARSACVMTGNGILLGGKEERTFLPIASTTKILTALLTLEMAEGQMDTPFLAGNEVRVEGSALGIKPGAEVTPRLLVWGMLLSSGNDAAEAAAAHFGGKEAFLLRMNHRAQTIGMEESYFLTPSGLDAEADGKSHGSTARDMALLAAEALQNPDFLEICSSQSGHMEVGGVSYWMTNHNKLLDRFPGCIGVKTGYTKKAGRCLIAAAERDGARIIVSLLNAPNDWEEAETLLDWGFSQLKEVTLTCPGLPDSVKMKSAPTVFLAPGETLVPSFALSPLSERNGETAAGIVKWTDQNGVTRAWTALEWAEKALYLPTEAERSKTLPERSPASRSSTKESR